jgi:hypothetical protein
VGPTRQRVDQVKGGQLAPRAHMSVARGRARGCPRGMPRQQAGRSAPASARTAAVRRRGSGFACRAPFGAWSGAFEPHERRRSNGGGGTGGGGRSRRRRRPRRRRAPVRCGESARGVLARGFRQRSNGRSTRGRTGHMREQNGDEAGRTGRSRGGRSGRPRRSIYGERGGEHGAGEEGGVAHRGRHR